MAPSSEAPTPVLLPLGIQPLQRTPSLTCGIILQGKVLQQRVDGGTGGIWQGRLSNLEEGNCKP